MNLYGFVGNDGVNASDYLGMTPTVDPEAVLDVLSEVLEDVAPILSDYLDERAADEQQRKILNPGVWQVYWWSSVAVIKLKPNSYSKPCDCPEFVVGRADSWGGSGGRVRQDVRDSVGEFDPELIGQIRVIAPQGLPLGDVTNIVMWATAADKSRAETEADKQARDKAQKLMMKCEKDGFSTITSRVLSLRYSGPAAERAGLVPSVIGVD